MEASPALHPAAGVLKAFASGKLDDAAAETVMSHLDSCPDCCRAVAASSGDDFLDRLRQARSRSGTPAPAKTLTQAGRPVPPAASQTAIPNLPPELAGSQQYEVLRELGRGGMGVVYLAKNLRMDRLEVLKVVNKALLDRPGAVERFLREIRSAAKLSHPNIVQAYSAPPMGDLLVLAMEYVKGEDLDKVVAASGPLPLANACYYAQQAAQGLQHAFEKGMVHRDIKPQNLILAREGKKHVVKILDFGLAKATREKGEEGEDTGLTGEGKMLGTPDYIAPEQTLDAAHADIRADVYSLGCTLYFLLTADRPFKGRSLADILLAHQLTQAKPLNLLRPEVPVELAAVVAKMMAKEPARRYQKPAEVAQALSPLIKPGAKAVPDGTPRPPAPKPVAEDYSVAKSTTVHPAGAAETAVPEGRPVAPPATDVAPVPAWVELTEHGQAVIASTNKGTTRKRRPPTVKPAPKKLWLAIAGAAVGVLLLVLGGLWAAGVFNAGVVNVKTADGVLVVQVNEPNADVFVDGDRVTVTWGDGGKQAEIHVKPGTRKVEVKKDGFSADGAELTFKDGDREIFTARLVPERDVAKADAPLEKSPPPDLPPEKVPAPPPDRQQPVTAPAAGTADGDKDFVPLFNGKDLSGWRAINSQTTNWSVENGLLVGRGKGQPGGEFGQLVTDAAGYANFDLRAELMLSAPQSSSLRFRVGAGDDLASIVSKGYGVHLEGTDQKRTDAVQLQTGTVRMGGVYAMADRVLGKATQMAYEPGKWFTLEVIAMGNQFRVKVDGQAVADCEDPERSFSVGRIGLLCRPVSVIRFRKIEIKELPPADGAAAPAPAADGFVQLFNGKSLDGWKTHPSQPGNWRVEQGILIGSSDGVSHLYTERGDYTDFHLRLEARINEGGNSTGVDFRAPFGPTLPSNVKMPVSPSNKLTWVGAYSAKIDTRRLGGLLVDPSPELHRTREPVLRPGEWITFEIIAEGDHFVIKVNGETTSDYTDEQRHYAKGHIVLQQHGAATVAEFRKIEIKELTPAKPFPAPEQPAPAPAADDPIGDKLEQARSDYDAAVDKYQKRVHDGLDKAEEAARGAGEKDRVDKIKADRDAFYANGDLPKSIPTRDYKLDLDVARASMDRAYASAIAAYTKANRDDKAAALTEERKLFQEAHSTDVFQDGSVWLNDEKGYKFTVIERKGERFRARFLVGEFGDREINGTVKGRKVSWLAKDVRPIRSGPGWDNQGTLTHDKDGDLINFVWQNDKGGSGAFTLRLRTGK